MGFRPHEPVRLRIAANERTCLVCGETAMASNWHEAADWHCPRCEDRGVLVPTVSYLKQGEYEVR
jgi:hypothetical protein